MAELTHQERLQPALLDRLTDNEPERQQESRNERVINPARLRELVQRDLSFLFNTTDMASLQPEVRDYPEVARSVLNYGLPDFAGHTTTGIDVPELERLLVEVIRQYEPRLLPESIRVKLTVDPELMSHHAMTFVIEASLWAQPIPLRLFLKTAIDLESGQVEVEELPSK